MITEGFMVTVRIIKGDCQRLQGKDFPRLIVCKILQFNLATRAFLDSKCSAIQLHKIIQTQGAWIKLGGPLFHGHFSEW